MSTVDYNELIKPFSNDIATALLVGGGFLLARYAYNSSKARIQNLEQEASKKRSKGQSKPNKLLKYNIYLKDNFVSTGKAPTDILIDMEIDGISPDITTYNTLLDACFMENQREVALELFNRMKDVSTSVEPDVITYNILIKGLNLNCHEGSSNHILEQAFEYFREMQELYDIKPNDITYNTLIDTCVKTENMDKAWIVYDDMSTKMTPDMFTYSTIIKGIKKSENDGNNLERVLNLLEKIQDNKDVKLDEIFFNCLIDASIRFKDFNKGIEIFEVMKKLNINPSAITFGILIKGYGECNQLHKCIEIFENLAKLNIEPNDVTYGCLIDACVKNYNIDLALKVFEEMKAKKFNLNSIIFTTLIKGFTKTRQFDKALEVYNYMLNIEKISPSVVTYNSLIDCALQCKNYDQAEQIFEDMKTSQLSESKPDLITYSTIVKAYSKNKQIEKAIALFNEMIKENMKLDEILFNSLLDGCVKNGKYNEALEIYDTMRKVKIRPSHVTYSILIKLHSGARNIDKALGVYEEMKFDGVSPGIIGYTCLLQSCIKNKKIENAIELFYEMLNSNIKPDHVTYNTIINGCVYAQKLEDACLFLSLAFKDNIRVAYDIYTNCLRNLLTNKYMDRKKRMHYCATFCKELNQRNIEIEEDLYNQIMKNLYIDNDKAEKKRVKKEKRLNNKKIITPVVNKLKTEQKVNPFKGLGNN